VESFKTVEKESSAQLVQKRSRFIAYVKPIISEDEADEFINSIKKKHWDARHNVYCYRINEKQIDRYSDDGEPQGTAGIPILNLLIKSDISDCVIVVTRYFGGILLGTGGLLRAYSGCAALALESANIIVMQQGSYYSTICDYNQYGKISAIIEEFNGKIEESLFNDSIYLKFRICDEYKEAFLKRAEDLTAGSANFEVLGKGFFKFDKKI